MTCVLYNILYSKIAVTIILLLLVVHNQVRTNYILYYIYTSTNELWKNYEQLITVQINSNNNIMHKIVCIKI